MTMYIQYVWQHGENIFGGGGGAKEDSQNRGRLLNPLTTVSAYLRKAGPLQNNL